MQKPWQSENLCYRNKNCGVEPFGLWWLFGRPFNILAGFPGKSELTLSPWASPDHLTSPYTVLWQQQVGGWMLMGLLIYDRVWQVKKKNHISPDLCSEFNAEQ